jgi:hypothetical protein
MMRLLGGEDAAGPAAGTAAFRPLVANLTLLHPFTFSASPRDSL